MGPQVDEGVGTCAVVKQPIERYPSISLSG